MKGKTFLAISAFTILIQTTYAQSEPMRCDEFMSVVSHTASLFPILEQQRQADIELILDYQKRNLGSVFSEFLDENDIRNIQTFHQLKEKMESYGPQGVAVLGTMSDFYTRNLNEKIEEIRKISTPIPDSALLAFYNGYNSAEFDTQQLDEFWGDNFAISTQGIKQCTFSRSHQALEMYYICTEAEFHLDEAGEVKLSYKEPMVKTIYMRFRDQLPSEEAYLAFMTPEKCKVHTLEETVPFSLAETIIDAEDKDQPVEVAIEGENSLDVSVEEVELP